MADYSGALQKFRESGYPKEAPDSPESDSKTGPRALQLTDEEAKELAPYMEKMGPGQEMVVEATGKLEGNTFRVMSVKYAQGGAPDVNADAEEMMSKFRDSQPPMVQSQTVPSPG